MNSRKTQVNKKLKSLDKRISNINKRLTSNAPVAISTRNGNKYGDYYRTHGKERISNVTALNSSFNIVDVFINPANSNLFPWLSGIGTKYDLYRFKRLKFSFVPSLPTSEEGNIYLGVDYNTLDPPPSSSTEICQLSHWAMNVVWKPTTLPVDLNSIDWLYTRTGPIANADYKTYDLGRLFFATEGINYSGIVGYVEVDYDVEFKRRQPDYINKQVPTTDVYNPVLTFNAGTIAPGANSSTLSDVFNNSSIFDVDAVNGRFTVNKSVNVYYLCNCDGSIGGNLYESTDGVTYVNAIYAGTTGTLVTGKYYKVHNIDTSNHVFSAIAIVLSNV